MGRLKKYNIAVTGGPGTGKSTLAAFLFARLKEQGLDYDLITEEKRRLHKEFGQFRSPFDRFYIWRQQERDELRSTAQCGFITDAPMFQLYASAKAQARSKRDLLAVRELFRMCLELDDRYQLIVIAKNPKEIPFRRNGGRTGGRARALRLHSLIRSFVEHFWPRKLLLVEGSSEGRLAQVELRLTQDAVLRDVIV